MLNELYKDCHITEKPLLCNLYIYQGQLGNLIEYHADVSFPLCFDAMTFNLQPNYFHYVSRITILTREIIFNGRCKILVLHVLFISIWCSNKKKKACILLFIFLFFKLLLLHVSHIQCSQRPSRHSPRLLPSRQPPEHLKQTVRHLRQESQWNSAKRKKKKREAVL